MYHQGVLKLFERMKRLKATNPTFCDITWGAGGSTADLTLDIAKRMQQEVGVECMMHLTCTNMEKDMVDKALAECKAAGIRNILALRGDPPKGQEKWTAVEGGFECGLDLVKYIRSQYGDYFGIAVAGYPEAHPEVIVEDAAEMVRKVISEREGEGERERQRERERERERKSHLVSPHLPSRTWGDNGHVTKRTPAHTFVTMMFYPATFQEANYQKDLAYLKAKVDAGADFIVTQLFYDVPQFETWIKDCRAAGITCPIIPGIMPVMSYNGFKRMTGFCKTRIPKEIEEKLESIQDDEEAVKKYGVELGIAIANRCLDIGIDAVHLYTLNTEASALAILEGVPRCQS